MPFLNRATMKSEISSPSRMGGMSIGGILRIIVRFLQFVLALTVAGLYGTDLHHAAKVHKYADSKWVYAVVVAGLSAFTSLVYMVPLIKSWMFFAWDFVLWILYLALFGLFGNMYIKEDPEGDSGVQRMKNAVWVDLVNMLLWFFTFVYSAWVFYQHRHGRSLFTGRATTSTV